MAGQGSARVTLKEIDLSQVRDPEQLPQGVPAAVVGTAKRGPAFVPQTFATIQQFNETFGSLNEVGKESNSNHFGPLALNEWMRNAQAGTFLRVLGAGNAQGPQPDGRTTDSGFIVGENISHNASTNKLQKNQHATIDDADIVGATKAGRTHFLGCFMKDVAGSKFLQDAGIEGSDAKASLTIKFDAVPADNSHITLISASGVPKTYGFKAGGTQITDQGDGVTIAEALVINTTSENTPAKVATALASLIQSGVGHNSGSNNSVISIVNDGSGQLVLTQATAGVSGNTEVSSRLFGAENEITITGSSTIKNSLADQTIKFREGVNGTKASAEIVINTETNTEDLHENNSISINALTDIGGSVSTIFTFKDGAGEAFNGEVFIESNPGNVHVLLGGADTLSKQKETLANLNTAINNATTSNVYLDGMRSTLSADGLTLTVFQGYAGVEGNGLNVVSTLSSSAFEIQGTPGDGAQNTDAFTGGVAADKASISLAFTGQPNLGDSITLPNFSTATNAEEFIFVPEPAVDVASVNGVVAGGKVQIEIGQVLAVTLDNIRTAISHNNGQLDDSDVTVTVTGSVVKIEAVATGLDENLTATLKLASTVVITNPQGDSVTGNFGTKTTNFLGGDSKVASPVIRGILMSPQGVVPTLDLPDSNTHSGTDATGFNESTHLRKAVATGANVIDFGSILESHLIGYEVGKVEIDQDQTFTLLLNGFSNTDEPAQLVCSFNPESPNYFSKVLNTDPTKIESRGHYLHASWDIDPAVAKADRTGLTLVGNGAASENYAAFCLHSSANRKAEANNSPNFESFDSQFKTAKSPWFLSQAFGEGTKYKLFKLHALDDGEIGCDRFRVLISNLRPSATEDDWGSFDLALEAFDSDPIGGEVLVQWKRLSLDPDSRNYIARVIGDKHMKFNFSTGRLEEEGDYEIRNKYVRVEVHDDVEGSGVRTLLPCGFKGFPHINTDNNELFDESGPRILLASSLNGLKVSPLPFVRSISRSSGATEIPSANLPWGIKFAKKKFSDDEHKELSEIHFNESIRSWTKFFPDMAAANLTNASFLVTDDDKVDSFENGEFSLEKIAVKEDPSNSTTIDYKNIDWGTSEYARTGTAPTGKVKISLGDAIAEGRNTKYLKFRCMLQGGFDGVNIFDEDKAKINHNAAFREASDEKDNDTFTGPTVETLKKAIDVLADKSAVEFQLLAIPGIREPLVTDHAIEACESRFDAMLVMDIEEKNESAEDVLDNSMPSAGLTAFKFADRQLDTSFAAAYFPDVLMRRPSNGTTIQVPPSVAMLGVMSRNDTLADPWFAPAGLTRGRLNAINSRVQMNRELLDTLYDKDINPIYEPAGRPGEVYAFGQKTLLQNQSALDRINVRRLLINVRRRVKAIAQTLLFEPNRESTLTKFSALVEPIMAEVQARQGVDRYKVQIDTTTTTQNDVENNTIRGKIYLQPTKSVEFISLDFVVTNSID